MKHNWEERIQKEFILEMQAKGKLPKSATDASERFSEAYNQSRGRIFPGPGGMDTVLDTMLRDSERKIAEAQRPPPPTAAAAARQQQTTRRAAHKEIKARLEQLGQDLEAERSARRAAEQEMVALQGGAAAPR